MKTLRCISRRVSGQLHVAAIEYGLVFEDGQEEQLPDDIADALLRNPNFEEVKPVPKQAAKADATAPAASPAPVKNEVK